MTEHTICLKPKEYNNIEDLISTKVDHVIIKRLSYYILIIHGSSQGFVQYNNQMVNFQQLAILLRQELLLDSTEELNVLVYCCFAKTQIEYIDKHTNICLMYSNTKELFCTLHHSFCRFAYQN